MPEIMKIVLAGMIEDAGKDVEGKVSNEPCYPSHRQRSMHTLPVSWTQTGGSYGDLDREN